MSKRATTDIIPAKGLADKANEEYQLGLQAGAKSIEHVIACGNILIAEKERLKHGEFIPWVEAYCAFEYREAANVMKVAKEMPPNMQRVAHLSLRGALKQIADNKKEAREAEQEADHAMKIGRVAIMEPIGEGERCGIVLADPPWRYEHVKTKSRKIENQYPTMALEEIRSLPIEEHLLADVILFMWATSPKLAESLTVLDAWGFTYRTCAIWDKQKLGMGYWFRQEHELILVGVRGKPKPPMPRLRRSSIIRADRGEHSAKPVELYEYIDECWPDTPKLELFLRGEPYSKTWRGWGVEASSGA